MLSVAEIEAGSFELRYDDVRAESLFEDLKAEFEPQAAEKNISLTFHLPPKFPPMQGDRDKITLAVHNLIANSLKYTPTGGRVDVSVEFSNQQLAIQVKDTGIGISEEEQDKVFDRFYRAKDTRVSKITGTGLGLTLAREVVRLHGGDIHVDSKLDHGSTFTLTIPTQKKAA
jgi:signal transduction histidine kinase